MKKDPLTWLRILCYALLCLLPVMYITVLIVLNKMGYSIRLLPRQLMYTAYIVLILVTVILRMMKPKRILPVSALILYMLCMGLLVPKGSETLVLYQDTLCISQVHDVWLETYQQVYYYQVENWFLRENSVLTSYRLNR